MSEYSKSQIDDYRCSIINLLESERIERLTIAELEDFLLIINNEIKYRHNTHTSLYPDNYVRILFSR